MEKAKILVISTNKEKSLTLARVLSDKLTADFSDAICWRDEVEGEVCLGVIEKLENTAKKIDFAVIVFTKSDVDYMEDNDEEDRQALDNWFYETGFFMATLGIDRFFLVADAEVGELPLNLTGIEPLHCEEPPDSAGQDRWNLAAQPALSTIVQSVQNKGRLSRRETLPLLSVDEVFERERLEREGGQLQEGYVMVCEVGPFKRELWHQQVWAQQVKQNADLGISYIFFFQADDDNIKKISLALTTMLRTDKEGKLASSASENEVILTNLKNILQHNSVNVYFMKSAPSFRFRIHNASDPQRARAYLRYGETPYFVEWQEGINAMSIWNFFHLFAGSREQKAIFRSNMDYKLYEEEGKDFLYKLKHEIGESLPEIKDEVLKLCFESEEKQETTREALHSNETFCSRSG